MRGLEPKWRAKHFSTVPIGRDPFGGAFMF
jgi:hypothetical protein